MVWEFKYQMYIVSIITKKKKRIFPFIHFTHNDIDLFLKTLYFLDAGGKEQGKSKTTKFF